MDIQEIIVIVVMVLCGILWLGPMCIAMYMEDQERKKRGEPPPNKALYDERQTLIRLRSGVHALFALGGYLGLWACLDVFGGQRGNWAWTSEVAPLVFGGVMLAAVVWTVECTLRDAAVGWNQKTGAESQVMMYGLYTPSLLYWGSSALEKGKTVLGCVIFMTSAGLFVVFAVTLYAMRRRKKRQEQEGE